MAKKITKKSIKDQKANKQVDSSQSKILKRLAQSLSDDYHPNHNYSQVKNGKQKDPEIQKINRMIDSSVEKISGNKEQTKESKPSFSPTSFDGVSSPKEERTLLIEKIKHLERDNNKFKHELELLHEDYQNEKTKLKNTIRELKGELHRTTPLTDNKLFSFSRELRHVASTVQALSEQDKPKFPSLEPSDNQDEEIEPLDVPKVSIDSPTKEKQSIEKDIKKIEKEPKSEEVKKPELKKEIKPKRPSKKIELTKQQKVIGGATAGMLVAFLALGAVLSNSNRVNNKVVEEYLNEQPQGQVQGTTTAAPGTPASQISAKKRYNDIPFEEVKWETFRDEFLGFQVEYPSNAVDLLHTGNTITFLRQDGYIFKVQKIATEETPLEYFERTNKNGLQYETQEVQFHVKDALHLILQEDTEFPGNRYLVQVLDNIFDIWYATESAQFKNDEMKYVKRMLDTSRFP